MKKVHVGFGFHVNLYHSFREDTNDQKGFAPDIRVIRHCISVLNSYNSRGIPVKGTWDFENAFSLEDVLPKYAPDIIEGVRRRVSENGDEPILMSYNNGSTGAMTREELEASMRMSISNDMKSGTQDIFGTYAPVSRPQEMMFSPSQTATYSSLGIKALCMYYSSIPFDSFRTIIPLLPEKYAFNPLTYRYKEDSIVFIPTYNTGDIIDYGSLLYWVRRLHGKQETGEIDNDVFIFINMDADSEFWYGLNYPFPLSKLPGLSGLQGLIAEIAELPYVTFDTPWNYLKTHPPLKEISFNHDIADGNFDGYSSWSEKPFNRRIWTRIERARALTPKKGKETEAFLKRVRLLSTTHFGLSTPHLNIRREKKALDLSAEMLKCMDADSSGVGWKGGTVDDLRYCLPASAEGLAVGSADLAAFPGVKPPSIEYNNVRHKAESPEEKEFDIAVNGFNLKGTLSKAQLNLPGQLESGNYSLTSYKAEKINGIFYSLKIKYPYTSEDAYVYNQIAALQRPQDDKWIEVCPFEINAGPSKGARIIKRNYEGDICDYLIDDFAKADPKNVEIDSFNHQVSNGIVGVNTTNGGFLLAVQKQVANSMAFCPMRIRGGRLFLNPFGTYYGKQRNHATHGNGLGIQAAIHSAPQYFPLAPSYNGAEEEILLAIFPFKDKPGPALWEQAIAFSDGSISAEEVQRDFCINREAADSDRETPLKKISSGIPVSIQIKIMISGIMSKIKRR
ncbi:MAG: hypothetical protein FWG77_03745 [Treponema sp.]|nr:hypothetical protein [Treponema sp.]